MFKIEIALFESKIRLVYVSLFKGYFPLSQDAGYHSFNNRFKNANCIFVRNAFVFILFSFLSSLSSGQDNPKMDRDISVVKETFRSAFNKIRAEDFDSIPIKGTYEY